MASLISRVVDSLRATRSSRLLTCASPNRDLTTRLHDGQHSVGRHRGARGPTGWPPEWTIGMERCDLAARPLRNTLVHVNRCDCMRPAGWVVAGDRLAMRPTPGGSRVLLSVGFRPARSPARPALRADGAAPLPPPRAPTATPRWRRTPRPQTAPCQLPSQACRRQARG